MLGELHPGENKQKSNNSRLQRPKVRSRQKSRVGRGSQDKDLRDHETVTDVAASWTEMQGHRGRMSKEDDF